MRALKVLILEDNSFQLMALHQMLNATGVFDVLTAENVESARQSLANRGPIDVAICDLQLEAGDGLELIRSLAEGREAQALIILSSAEQEVLEGAAHMARQQGLHVLGCLRKPASAAALADLLASYQQRFARQRPACRWPRSASCCRCTNCRPAPALRPSKNTRPRTFSPS